MDDDPLEKYFAKRGEKQHKSGKKKVVSTIRLGHRVQVHTLHVKHKSGENKFGVL